jgi:hypothetical protein
MNLQTKTFDIQLFPIYSPNEYTGDQTRPLFESSHKPDPIYFYPFHLKGEMGSVLFY